MPRLEGNRTRLIWCVWALFLLGFVVRGWLQPHRANCFYPCYYNGGLNWRLGNDLYLGLNDTCRYSPLVHSGLAPFSLLSEKAGAAAWRIFEGVSLLAALSWWMKTSLPAGWSDNRRAWFLVLTIPLMMGNLNSGQTNSLVMAGILGCVAALNRERWGLAACLLSVSCFIKLYPITLGLLLIVVYPRQFSWRLGLALAAGALLPFVIKDPEYVWRQYGRWLGNLKGDDRSQWPLHAGYRDGWLLFRYLGIPLTFDTYRLLTAAIGAGIGGLVLAAKLRGQGGGDLLQRTVGLACCWMTVFGPATEGHTYILVSTALLLTAFTAAGPLRFAACFAAGCFLASPIVQAGPLRSLFELHLLMPVGTLALFGILVAQSITPARRQAALPIPARPQLRGAA